MKNYEWIIHCVYNPEVKGENIYINAHTHGMEKFNHPDFQVVLNLPSDLISYLLNTMGNKVKNGEVFKDGDTVEGLIATGYTVKLIEYEETERNVLRLVFPDENHYFPEDTECNSYYKGQLTATDKLLENQTGN